jgi:hypothetical protein
LNALAAKLSHDNPFFSNKMEPPCGQSYEQFYKCKCGDSNKDFYKCKQVVYKYNSVIYSMVHNKLQCPFVHGFCIVKVYKLANFAMAVNYSFKIFITMSITVVIYAVAW